MNLQRQGVLCFAITIFTYSKAKASTSFLHVYIPATKNREKKMVNYNSDKRTSITNKATSFVALITQGLEIVGGCRASLT